MFSGPPEGIRSIILYHGLHPEVHLDPGPSASTKTNPGPNLCAEWAREKTWSVGKQEKTVMGFQDPSADSPSKGTRPHGLREHSRRMLTRAPEVSNEQFGLRAATLAARWSAGVE